LRQGLGGNRAAPPRRGRPCLQAGPPAGQTCRSRLRMRERALRPRTETSETTSAAHRNHRDTSPAHDPPVE
jgi:hypothetical protein